MEARLLAGICSRKCVYVLHIYTDSSDAFQMYLSPTLSLSLSLLPTPFFYFLSLFRLTLRVSGTSLAVMEGQERGRQRSEM